MYAEKRLHPRVKPKNLTAHITINRPPDETLAMDGTVVDLSYSGIKIKLSTPLIAEINDQITINLQLPKSGIPIRIHGVVVHRRSAIECGLHFVDQPPRQAIDDLMFECVKHHPSLPSTE
ncbi:MAG: PilZ domain-containing protein [Gammaproteobacteria bacterium]|nr:MAG: PilZ domain-containing protein [Gammaproteobacteria bacterium]